MDKIDIGNHQLVGTNGDTISVMFHKPVMSKDEALVHAAWLVVLSDPLGEKFNDILKEIQNT